MLKGGHVKVKVDSTEAAITGFAGASLLSRISDSIGMTSGLDRFLKYKKRNRGYAPSAGVFDLMLLGLRGGGCIDDLGVLRSDAGLRRLLGRRVMAPSTAHDLLRGMGQSGLAGLEDVRREALRVMAEHVDETRATLDCDATFIPSKASTARKGYVGERGWMPMLAFWGELGAVVHEEFRHGNEAPGGGALPFLKATLRQLPERVKRIYVRSDSAWYQAEVMDYCQDKGIGFSITADKDEAVKALIEKAYDDDAWEEFDAGSESGLREWAHETVHTLNNSKHSYRMILLRREKKELDLFDGEYIHGAIITNMDKPLVPQLIWHRERCNCENHIKELKYGLPLSKLPSSDFDVNAAFFRIMTLAWNLLAALKHFVLDESWRYLTLKTIRFRLLAMPALVMKHARQLWLKLPRGRPYAPILKQALA